MLCGDVSTLALSILTRQSYTTIYLRKSIGRTDVAKRGVYESESALYLFHLERKLTIHDLVARIPVQSVKI